MPKKTLEIFTDVVCPWCYVGVARAKKLAAEHDVELVYTAFPLHPDTPAGGVLLTDLFKGRGFDLEKSHAELAKLCEAEGLGWTSQPRLDSSRLAQELWKHAEAQGAHGVHDALFRANFVDAKDIGGVDVLVGVAESLGLDGAAARKALEERTYRAAVDRDWARARSFGITGVPTFVHGNRGVVGAQPVEALAKLLGV
jgi:predicted DsbA family dithiol-disulfide isomerase